MFNNSKPIRILFFEVRSKTKLYYELAKLLEKKHSSIEIHWVIQNKLFSYHKKNHIAHFINYPKFQDVKNYGYYEFDTIDKKVVECDRFMLHFGNEEPWYYSYYRNEIDHIINTVEPHFIFGEVGNFFTHYGALLAKQKGIPFFDVETSRYPTGAISFFQYDSWNPIKLRNSSEVLAKEFLEYFNFQSHRPDYMKVNRTFFLNVRRLLHRLKLLMAYIMGERFCTQNPLIHLLHKQKLKQKLIIWERNATFFSELQSIGKKILLYPLQMQPEFNLEVWGHPLKSQAKLIEILSKKIPDNWILVIKANPKCYFEANLLNIYKLVSTSNVRLLNLNTKMDDIIKDVDMVATVTGTVQIERLLMNKPVYVIGNTPFSKYSCIKTDLEKLERADFLNGMNFRLNNMQLIEISKYLLEHSTNGLMSEPVTNPQCLSSNNIELLCSATEKVIEEYLR